MPVLIDPTELREGDTLCGDDGTPFATVEKAKVRRNGGVWVTTVRYFPVSFPKGTFAYVIRKENG